MRLLIVQLQFVLIFCNINIKENPFDLVCDIVCNFWLIEAGLKSKNITVRHILLEVVNNLTNIPPSF